VKTFFVGWHQPRNGPSGCAEFSATMISVNRLIGRRSGFPVQDWILDSGAFTRIASGRGHLPAKLYAKEIARWSGNGNLRAAVSQDFMCEAFILGKTGLTIADHQRLTIHRYDRLLCELQKIDPEHPYLMPVLQGFAPAEYAAHPEQYGDRLKLGQWVGVGSVCKRNGDPSAIEAVLLTIKTLRPDLRLHGFGLKRTALKSAMVWDLLETADSMAPSYHARKNPQKGRSSNDPRAALEYAQALTSPAQMSIFAALGDAA
jgi:hypothetical protein